MTIQTSNEHQRAFSDSEMDQRVVWDDYQRADLDDDLEAYLVKTYDPITYVDESEEIADAEDEDEIDEVFSVEEKAAGALADLDGESEENEEVEGEDDGVGVDEGDGGGEGDG